ncbi:hypothetical protein [Streptomyces smyrnaeus]|uniref:hypothetical protein n=1 Tax=Streptomyces smyrnaeus TaxID=1387713 RepID=UPI0033CACECB
METHAANDEILAVLAAEHGVTVEEWDTASLDPMLREHFMGWHHRIGDRRYLIFPKGQDPAERPSVARALLARTNGEVQA